MNKIINVDVNNVELYFF